MVLNPTERNTRANDELGVGFSELIERLDTLAGEYEAGIHCIFKPRL
jgi:hypothetical protein